MSSKTETRQTDGDAQHKRSNTEMGRRRFLKTVGVGAGTVAVGASGVGPVPEPVGESEAFLPAAAAVVAGVGVAGALGAFVESKYNVLGSDAPPDSLGPEALKDQVIQTARTRKSTTQSTLTDNKNLVTYVKEPAFVEGKVAAVKAINNEKTQAEVETAALNAANSHITTVEKNLLNTWNEATAELFAMKSSLSSAGISGFVNFSASGSLNDTVVEGSTQVTLADDSTIQVTILKRQNESEQYSPLSRNSGQLGSPVRIRVGPNRSDTVNYLLADGWVNTWSELQTVETDVTNNLVTWVNTAYNQVQSGQLNPDNLLSPTDLADEYSGENSRAIADLQAMNIPNAGGNEATIKVSDEYNSRMTGLLANSDGTTSNVTAGTTIDPSTSSGDWFISHDLGKWTSDVTSYYDSTYGIQGGEIRANRNPLYHYGTPAEGVSHVVETSQGETAEIPTSEFTEKLDSNNTPYWTVNISGKLSQSTADITKVTAVTTGEQSGIYRTEQLTNQFKIVETSNGELSFDPPREPQTDSNYLTQEEWDNLESNTKENIDAYEESQSSLPSIGDSLSGLGGSVRDLAILFGLVVLGLFGLNAASG